MTVPENSGKPQGDLSVPAEEPSQLPPRVLYGYVRVVQGDKERAAALKADLLSFCRTYGYMLGTVFTDWGVDDAVVARPGFSSLLDVCKLVGSYGVVVPSKRHLSSQEVALDVLQRHIQRAGATLIVIDEFTANLHRSLPGDCPKETNTVEVAAEAGDDSTEEGDEPC